MATSEIEIKARATHLRHAGNPNYADNGESVAKVDQAASSCIRIRSDAAADLNTGTWVRNLASRLSREYRHISRDPRIRKGMPHVKGTRIAVGHVLSHVEKLGSIEATVEAYDSTINAEQVKEAIAYARDFLEEACDPTPPQTTG